MSTSPRNVHSGAEESTTARSGGEVRARLLAERTGRPFLVLRDGTERQRVERMLQQMDELLYVGESAALQVGGWG